MKKIFKYPIQVTDAQIVRLPQNYRILSCQMQRGELCLWVLVNPEGDEYPATIVIYGTGHDVLLPWERLNYISTVQDGGLVWHVFEQLP